ncbi:Kelch repeat-containing protein [Neoroseomonas rubea]|uniref:Kelch repeat-containing protein n=1 Tax=Neoroseomonas rubea TaxID=2748666 RepID=UPI0018E04585|nr:kelch-like protein [Roseomonas rubea]
MNRRTMLGAGAALLAGVGAARAQHHGHHGGNIPADQMSALRGPNPQALTPQQLAQRVIDSPAPPGPPGRWVARAPLPLPRSEMAWATSWNNRLHVIGGYAQGQVDKPYHHIYDPAADRWQDGAPLPRGANHVGVVADAGRIYALGGFTEQNRAADALAFAYDVARDRWDRIAPMPRPRGAGAVAAVGGKIYHIGGATDPAPERASIGWTEVYDPQGDRWTILRALPAARDHAGVAVWEGKIHIVGGRFNTFENNTGLHHVYDPASDTWRLRAPIPTPRSGHGMVLLRGRMWCFGGEERLYDAQNRPIDRVLGSTESYDPATDSWMSHAPMPTPRHGLGAALVGEWIHVAGGGPIVGGAIQTAVHEAFQPG